MFLGQAARMSCRIPRIMSYIPMTKNGSFSKRGTFITTGFHIYSGGPRYSPYAPMEIHSFLCKTDPKSRERNDHETILGMITLWLVQKTHYKWPLSI